MLAACATNFVLWNLGDDKGNIDFLIKLVIIKS